jgi:hypoxanthine phosphoribosyltransferase
MIKITFPEIKNALDKFHLPIFDIVIGIAEGGLVPAALTANKLGAELACVKINYRDDNNIPIFKKPEIIRPLNRIIEGKSILIVDDVAVTGKTLEQARSLFIGNRITTFVFKGKADYVLLPDLKDCVNWPWKYANNFQIIPETHQTI